MRVNEYCFAMSKLSRMMSSLSCQGLSRMMGNYQVRFLGDGVWETGLCYPTLNLNPYKSLTTAIAAQMSKPESELKTL